VFLPYSRSEYICETPLELVLSEAILTADRRPEPTLSIEFGGGEMVPIDLWSGRGGARACCFASRNSGLGIRYKM
jgi:hypothetical protein